MFGEASGTSTSLHILLWEAVTANCADLTGLNSKNLTGLNSKNLPHGLGGLKPEVKTFLILICIPGFYTFLPVGLSLFKKIMYLLVCVCVCVCTHWEGQRTFRTCFFHCGRPNHFAQLLSCVLTRFPSKNANEIGPSNGSPVTIYLHLTLIVSLKALFLSRVIF